MYDKGQGVEKSNLIAESWRLKAANQGHVKAIKELTRMYGDNNNDPQAYYWASIAVALGQKDMAQTKATLANKLTSAQLKTQDTSVQDWLKKHIPLSTKKPSISPIGIILNYNLALDYYVVNVGTDNGIRKGDKFAIFRGGKAIGKIEIILLPKTTLG